MAEEKDLRLGKKRFAGMLTDVRMLLIEELKKDNLAPSERTALLLKLADLQIAASNKWIHRNKGNKPGGKRGRPRKMFDGHGEPLYIDSPKPKDTTEDSNRDKFLNEI